MFRMTVSDVFFIRGRGTVITGKVEDGVLRVGDEVRINDARSVRVDGIEAFRRILDEAKAGENIGILFKKLDRNDVKRGDVLTGGDDIGAIQSEEAGFAAPAPPSPSAPPGGDPRFAAVEAQRVQFLSMRDAGLMTDSQIDESLRALIFDADHRQWMLKTDSDEWYSSTGEEWRHDTPPQ